MASVARAVSAGLLIIDKTVRARNINDFKQKKGPIIREPNPEFPL
jgi:hypothetical protein